MFIEAAPDLLRAGVASDHPSQCSLLKSPDLLRLRL